MHHRFGQRGIALIAPVLKIIAYAVLCSHPPFPVLPISMLIAGFANGLEDAAWNAWIGNMVNANEMLGILHGLYGLGGTIAPLIATAMITKANLQWYNFYYIMVRLLHISVLRSAEVSPARCLGRRVGNLPSGLLESECSAVLGFTFRTLRRTDQHFSRSSYKPHYLDLRCFSAGLCGTGGRCRGLARDIHASSA